MAQNTNNQELKQLAIRTLAEGREEISAEVHRVREQLSPVRMLQRVVDHHAGLTVALAVAAGLIPALLIFRGRRYPDRLSPPLTISVAKPPRKSMLGALVLGGARHVGEIRHSFTDQVRYPASCRRFHCEETSGDGDSQSRWD